MKTTCWYEERRNLVGVFDFRSFHRFFVLVARWRWACFVLTSLFCVFFCFHCQGRILFLNCQTAEGRGQLGCFAWPRPPQFCLFVFVDVLCCVVCFSSSSHYIYIYGGISFWTHAWHLLWLKSCRLSVCLFHLSTSTSSSIRSYCFFVVVVRSISRIVSACASL